ncbi:hypothetical protein PR003_g12675 [Phytophthora rubi]|uniref:Uncharacterized protein n=1 Tax=Phytophthora rubi TaxID=129364 RepID=A0A6A4F8Y9_9STRA|nr:hypothetical protein PR002_g11401 [Phytophthora rubi]KAE9336118.1 hypothetical protein PR003_g12675 [Phytophthora rubi]
MLCRGALLRRASISGLRHQPFSSSSTPKAFGFLSDYAQRLVSRHGDFRRYEDWSVFPPENSSARNYVLFCKLQRPSNTEIDANEFLDGALEACGRIIQGTYSGEMRGYMLGRQKGAKPAVAKELETMFEPLCYQKDLLPIVRLNLKPWGEHITHSKLEITSVFLTGVEFKRMTLAEFKANDIVMRSIAAEMESLMKAKPHFLVRLNPLELLHASEATKKWLSEEEATITAEDEETMVERLQLDVVCNFTFFLDTGIVDTVDTTNYDKVDKSFSVSFESLVTRPDDVDWRIKKLNQI